MCFQALDSELAAKDHNISHVHDHGLVSQKEGLGCNGASFVKESKVKEKSAF